MTNHDQKVIDKIRAILNLAHNEGATKGEAENAAMMAARLLQQHNLTESEVMGMAGSGDDSQVIEIRYTVPGDEDLNLSQNWFLALLNAVAKATFTKPMLSPQSRTVWFIGRKREVEAAQVMFSTFYGLSQVMTDQEMKRVQSSFRATHREGYFEYLARIHGTGKPKQKRDWRKSYLLGLALGIYKALEKETEEFQQKGGSAIVLYREAEINSYVQNKYPKAERIKGRENDINPSAYQSGVTAGTGLARSYSTEKLGDGNS